MKAGLSFAIETFHSIVYRIILLQLRNNCETVSNSTDLYMPVLEAHYSTIVCIDAARII